MEDLKNKSSEEKRKSFDDEAQAYAEELLKTIKNLRETFLQCYLRSGTHLDGGNKIVLIVTLQKAKKEFNLIEKLLYEL